MTSSRSLRPAQGDLERTNLTPFTLDIGSVEDLVVNAKGSGDNIAVGDLSSTDLKRRCSTSAWAAATRSPSTVGIPPTRSRRTRSGQHK